MRGTRQTLPSIPSAHDQPYVTYHTIQSQIERKVETEIESALLRSQLNARFLSPEEVFDGGRPISVVLAACFETRNRDFGA